VIFLTIIGILFIYSANINKADELHSQYIKQIIFAFLGLAFLIILLFISEKKMQELTLFFYVFFIIGLIATLFFPEIKGQKRFSINIISIQFSEFMKIAAILMLAKFYSNKSKDEIKDIKTYLKSIVIIIIPVFLIVLQPDLGTLLVYFPILLTISFIAGVKKRYLGYSILLFFSISLIPVVTTLNSLFYNNENEILSLFTNTKYVIIIYITLSFTLILSSFSFFNIIKGISKTFKKIFYWIMYFCSVIFIGTIISYPVNSYILKQYQKDRLLIFFNPNFDPQIKGYNIIQSITTIGNGGIFGKGWCNGDQTQSFFLPEQATDFIFPVIAEELGFFGSFLVLFLFSLIFYRSFTISLNSRHNWEAYTIIGILSMFLYHLLQNIGMTVGIMPITGIPLPFLSYGGSFLITCYIGIGIIMNIQLNRYQY
jgi:rod shape determining protein RodA